MRRASSASFAWISASVTSTSVRSASISRASIPVCSLLSYGERMPRAYRPGSGRALRTSVVVRQHLGRPGGAEHDPVAGPCRLHAGKVDRSLAVPVGGETGDLEGLRARERDPELRG